MDFGEPSPWDELQRLEHKVNRLVMLSVAQTVFLAIAVVMYVVSLASTYLFWIVLVVVIGVAAWALREKTPARLKKIGRYIMCLMRTKTEHTTVAVPPVDSNESMSTMVS